MESGTCKLCLQNLELAHSHVFSEFLYEHAYDEKHRYMSVSTHPRQKPKLVQVGLREYLLCLDCEKHINSYEKYSANLLRGVDTYRSLDNQRIVIPNYDYHLFKLFGLSLIWRAHISSHHFFSAVNLGPHADRIRQMILSNDPGQPREYCFSLLKIDGALTATRMLQAPVKVRFQNHNAYQLMALGFEWVFIISSHSDYLTDEYPFIGLTPELVILIEHTTQGRFIQDMVEKMPTLTRK